MEWDAQTTATSGETISRQQCTELCKITAFRWQCNLSAQYQTQSTTVVLVMFSHIPLISHPQTQAWQDRKWLQRLRTAIRTVEVWLTPLKSH